MIPLHGSRYRSLDGTFWLVLASECFKKLVSMGKATIHFGLLELLTCLRQMSPEKLIKEWTGHKSLDALRLYEPTSSEQQKSVSNLMCSFSKPNEFQFSSLAGGNTSSAFSSYQTVFKDFDNCTFNITFNQKLLDPNYFLWTFWITYSHNHGSLL